MIQHLHTNTHMHTQAHLRINTLIIYTTQSHTWQRDMNYDAIITTQVIAKK